MNIRDIAAESALLREFNYSMLRHRFRVWEQQYEEDEFGGTCSGVAPLQERGEIWGVIQQGASWQRLLPSPLPHAVHHHCVLTRYNPLFLRSGQLMLLHQSLSLKVVVVVDIALQHKLLSIVTINIG